MAMEFITTDAKLTIKDNIIRQKKLIYRETYWWAHFVVLLILLIYKIVEVSNAFNTGNNEDKIDFIWIPILIMWMYPHLKRISESLFIKTWKSSIPLSKIKDIKVIPLENTLETKVVLTLGSGRKKFYTFRNAENQVHKFVEAVNERMTSLTLVPSP
jgi:hypothetical protein